MGILKNPISQEVILSVGKMISFNAYKLQWYPVERFEKLWIADQQVARMQAAALFTVGGRMDPFRHSAQSMLRDHAIVTFLNVCGARACAWLRDRHVSDGQPRCLRWGKVKLTLVRFTEDHRRSLSPTAPRMEQRYEVVKAEASPPSLPSHSGASFASAMPLAQPYYLTQTKMVQMHKWNLCLLSILLMGNLKARARQTKLKSQPAELRT